MLDGAGTPPKETGDGAEEVELPGTLSQRGLEEQEGPRQGILFSSPSKRPPRAISEVKRSPMAKASAVQPHQLTRPVGEALDTAGQMKKVKKPPLDPEIEKRVQEKARLQREIEELEAQVSRCANEIVAEQQRGEDGILLPTQRADLM